MGYYNVIRACVVGKLHYATPTTQPIEVDDAVAEPLVAEGCLQPYKPGAIDGATGTVLDGVMIEPQSGLVPRWNEGDEASGVSVASGQAVHGPTPKPRRGKRLGA